MLVVKLFITGREKKMNPENIIIYSVLSITVLIIFGMLVYSFKLWISKQKHTEEPKQEEVKAIRDFNQANKHLKKLLDNLEENSNNAGNLINDIREKTRNLVSLAIGLYREAEELNEEIKFLDAAIDAVTNKNIGKIRRSGAELKDIDLQQILQAEIVGNDYWDKAIETLNNQAGLMAKQSKEFRKLAIGLLSDVRNNKARLVYLQKQRKFADYARPLLESSLDIQNAEHLLIIPTNDKIRQFVIDLPIAYSELPDGL